MGFLEDLIQTIQEAAAEARGEPPPKRPVREPAWQPTRQAQAAAPSAERRRVQAPSTAVARPPTTIATAEPIETPTTTPVRAGTAVVGDVARYRRLLHDPIYRRDLIVLKEILDRPLSLRRRR